MSFKYLWEGTQNCAGPWSIVLRQTAYSSMAGPLCESKSHRCTDTQKEAVLNQKLEGLKPNLSRKASCANM